MRERILQSVRPPERHRLTHLALLRPPKKFFRRKSARDLLPAKPVEISVEPWWVAQTGFITEDDIRVRVEEEPVPAGCVCQQNVSLMCVLALLQICSPAEKKSIDKMIDSGPQLAGSMEYNVVLSESEPNC